MRHWINMRRCRRGEGRESVRLRQKNGQSSGDHRELRRRGVEISTLNKNRKLRSKQCVERCLL
eukprot:7716607-Heterocapsa_arctica.AAC.2